MKFLAKTSFAMVLLSAVGQAAGQGGFTFLCAGSVASLGRPVESTQFAS